MRQDGPDRSFQAERRNLVSSAFIGLLIALAFAEAVGPVRESVRSFGLTLGTAMLFLAFFLTIMRFFIGAILHLVSPELVTMPGRVWFFDFMVITIESVVFVFLGGVSTVGQSLASPFGFAGLLLLLYALDTVWIVIQWILQKLFPSFGRPIIPWAWAILNTILIAALLVPRLWTNSFYTNGMLVWLGGISAAAFVIDVILVDYYDVI